MTQPTLFDMPPKPIRKRGPRRQSEKCARCGHGDVHDKESGYCFKHDLSLEFSEGRVYTLKDAHSILCDGGEWEYEERKAAP